MKRFDLYFLAPRWVHIAHVGRSDVVFDPSNVTDGVGAIGVDDHWRRACDEAVGLAGAATASEGAEMKLVMGSVTDYFRPTAGHTLCEMLVSNGPHSKFEWSRDRVTWWTPAYSSGADHYGGSAASWPRDYGATDDERKFLSFWGLRSPSIAQPVFEVLGEMTLDGSSWTDSQGPGGTLGRFMTLRRQRKAP